MHINIIEPKHNHSQNQCLLPVTTTLQRPPAPQQLGHGRGFHTGRGPLFPLGLSPHPVCCSVASAISDCVRPDAYVKVTRSYSSSPLFAPSCAAFLSTSLCMHAHARACAHTHTHWHTCTHVHTHMYTHTYMHPPPLPAPSLSNINVYSLTHIHQPSHV